MRPRPKQEEQQVSEEWLVTYADAITALLAYFVMIITSKDYDAEEREAPMAAIRENLGRQESAVTPMFSFIYNMNSILEGAEVSQEQSEVGFDQDGVALEFSSKAFYGSGRADLLPGAQRIFLKVFKEMQVPTYNDYCIGVKGHTDKVPIRSERFPSNWQLSAARASPVLGYLIEVGIKPSRLKAMNSRMNIVDFCSRWAMGSKSRRRY